MHRIEWDQTSEIECVKPTYTTKSRNGDQSPQLPNEEKDTDWPYAVQQLNEHAIESKTTKELCVPILSAIKLKQKQKMLLAPMDFKNLSMDALFNSEALVNCLPECDVGKIKSISPENILKEMEPQPSSCNLQMATKRLPPICYNCSSK